MQSMSVILRAMVRVVILRLFSGVGEREVVVSVDEAGVAVEHAARELGQPAPAPRVLVVGHTRRPHARAAPPLRPQARRETQY